MSSSKLLRLLQSPLSFPVIIVVLSFIIRYSANKNSGRPTITFKGGSKFPNLVHTNNHSNNTTGTYLPLISTTEKNRFQRDGYFLKKGVLKGDALTKAIAAGEKLYTSIHQNGRDVNVKSVFQKLSLDVWREDETFAQIAFESEFPIIAAELLGMIPNSDGDHGTADNGIVGEDEDTIRILKDGFFGLMSTDTGCGFHVDDTYFWPAAPDSTGVNFWLALSHMRVKEGGGIRVVDKTKIQPYFDECKEAIQTPFHTCMMEKKSPTCHERMMKASKVFDMEPGDVLIWDRWTFHRSEPFKKPSFQKDQETGQERKKEQEEKRLRYTIRYIPGTAKAGGLIREESSQELGKVFNSPYYPQVWPQALKSEITAIHNGFRKEHVISLWKKFKSRIKSFQA